MAFNVGIKRVGVRDIKATRNPLAEGLFTKNNNADPVSHGNAPTWSGCLRWQSGLSLWVLNVDHIPHSLSRETLKGPWPQNEVFLIDCFVKHVILSLPQVRRGFSDQRVYSGWWHSSAPAFMVLFQQRRHIPDWALSIQTPEGLLPEETTEVGLLWKEVV